MFGRLMKVLGGTSVLPLLEEPGPSDTGYAGMSKRSPSHAHQQRQARKRRNIRARQSKRG